MTKISRKEFFKKTKTVIGGIICAKVFTDIFIDKYEKYNLHRIYNELPSCIHLAKTTGEIIVSGKQKKVQRTGYGIVLNNMYLTLAHIHDISLYGFGKPFSTFRIPDKVKSKKTELYGKELEELVYDTKNDLAIYRLHPNLQNKVKFLSFPCNPSTKISLGEEIYLIGNPRLTGNNIRKGYISDLNGFNGIKKDFDVGKKSTFFGIDTMIMPGDSGTPVINANFELLGLCAISFYGLGYVKKIGEYLNEIKCIEESKFQDEICIHSP